MNTQTNTYTVPARQIRKLSTLELVKLGLNFGLTLSELRETAYAARQIRLVHGEDFHLLANVILRARRSEANRQGHISRKLRAAEN